MIIQIKNLKIGTIIGIYDWEKEKKQDVIINTEIEFDGTQAGTSDDIRDTVDYDVITKNIIKMVENNQFNLVEKIVHETLNLIMENTRIRRACVEVDKPGALENAESVSIKDFRQRQ